MIEDAKQLLERDAEWSALASEGRDIERILSYWTDDAVVMPPGIPTLRGKAAVRAFVESALRSPGFNIQWHSQDVHISADGSLAYMFSTNKVTMSGPDGAPAVTDGRALTIWRREDDGTWRCAVDIWNEDHRASASS